MKRILLAAITAIFFSPAVAHAVSTIVGGNYVLDHDTTTVIQILATGNDIVQGVNLILQVGDGSGSGPRITNVDLTGPGTIFHASNTGQVEVYNPLTGGQIWVGTTTVGAATVKTTGILAFVTIDTRGTAQGVFELWLGIPEFEVQSDWADPAEMIVPTLIHGTVIDFPEPSSLGLAALAGCGLMLHAIRRRRARLAIVAA